MQYELIQPETFEFESGFGEFETTPRTGTGGVRWVQRCLNKLLGLSLKVDGIAGPQTRSAVRTFQRQKGLKVDGIVGPRTQAALSQVCGATVVPAQLPGKPLGGPCDRPEYERLVKHCRDQAIGYVVNCCVEFGVEEGKAIIAAVGVVGVAISAAAIPPLAVILGLLGGAAITATMTAPEAYKLSKCTQDILRGLVTCLRNAKDATRCR